MTFRTAPFLLILLLAACSQEKPTAFRELKPEQTGIQFNNEIKEDQDLNVLNYEYIYNGGGVGIGDFNNDSLPDVYFTGNRVANRLYLNQGNLKFKDITEEAGVTGMGKWSKGASVVDINNDGLQDIYVCAAILPDSNARRNILYVNQGINQNGIPTFKDMAAEYGLDDASNTQMAAFFDYDNDGDLDVYLLNNDLDGTYPNEFRPIRKNGTWPNTDKLLQNRYDSTRGHAVFSNVSAAAGILIEGHGLGVNIADINMDGWKDIYVSNDYLSNNIFYINNRNGTFTDLCSKLLKHTSKNAMGNDINDINNDGLADIIELDMMPETNYRQKMMHNDISYQTFQNSEQYGYMYQYPRNTLQLNQGMVMDSIMIPAFSEIAFLAGVAHTDWSWTPLLIDLDNDSYRDLLISNGLPRDMSDLDFMAYRGNAVASAPLDTILKQLPSVKINNYIFRNTGKLGFEDVTKAWGIQTPTFSAGMAYADLDRDGDMDVVINNTNMPASVYENRTQQLNKEPNHYINIICKGKAQNKNALGAVVRVYHKGQQQITENNPYRGYLSTVENMLHFGLGKSTIVDSVIITYPGGAVKTLKQIKADTIIYVDAAGANIPETRTDQQPLPLFSYVNPSIGLNHGFAELDFIDFNIQKLIPHKLTQYGPSVAVGDINNDGLDDIIAGGSSPFCATVFTQQTDGRFSRKRIIDLKQPQLQDDAGLCLFDAEGDGDLDLYIASGGAENEPQTKAYADHFFVNDGKGNFTEKYLPVTNNRTSKSIVTADDFDGDGDLDLFLGGRVIPGSYPTPASSYIYRNDSRNDSIAFTDVTGETAPELQQLGLVTSAVFTDVNNDGNEELMIALQWGGIRTYQWKGKQWKAVATGLDSLYGWWNSIMPADLDNDGDMDYVAGNYGLNGYIRPTPEYPVRAYVADFDKNGSEETVFSYYQKATDGTMREYPLNGRDDLLKEISALKERFPNYSSFAQATMDEVFPGNLLKEAQTFKATGFASVWIENKGNFQFVVHTLPVEAQFAPVYGIVARDLDGNGFTDLVLNGNEYAMSPMLGRYDAFNGTVLLNQGKGKFQALKPGESGYYVRENGKALAGFLWKGFPAVAAMENRGFMKLFAATAAHKVEKLLPGETYAILQLKNGSIRKEEFPIGAGFLSQNARFIILDNQISTAEIHGKAGKRTVRP